MTERVVEKLPKVRDLVVNEWIHVFQLDPGTKAVLPLRQKRSRTKRDARDAMVWPLLED